MTQELAASLTPRNLWSRLLRRNTVRYLAGKNIWDPSLITFQVAQSPTPSPRLPPPGGLIIEQVYDSIDRKLHRSRTNKRDQKTPHPIDGLSSTGPLPRLSPLWSGARFNALVRSLDTDVEREIGMTRSRGFADFTAGMPNITKFCSYLKGWRMCCASVFVEETTNLIALEGCRIAMGECLELPTIGRLLKEAICLDPLDIGRAGQARLFARLRLLMHLTHVWETLARLDPSGEVACTRSFTQDPTGAVRLQSTRLERILESGRALNGITAAFGGSLGIIMLLPETFTACVHDYCSRPLISFYARLALRIPQLVEFCSLLEQQVFCATEHQHQIVRGLVIGDGTTDDPHRGHVQDADASAQPPRTD